MSQVGSLRTPADWLVQTGHWSGRSPDTGNTYDDEPTLGVVEAGAPSFTISGTARDVDAWLWNRPTLTDVRRDGDTSAFEAVIRTGIQ